MKKRLLSLCLAVEVLLGLLPGKVLAKELSTPFELTWGVLYRQGETKEMPGNISWQTVTKEEVLVKLYNSEDPNTPIWNIVTQNNQLDKFVEEAQEMAEGTYYFTVQAVDVGVDDTTYGDTIVVSDTWQYIKPTQKLTTIAASNLVWKEDLASWSNIPIDEDKTYQYEMEFFFSKTGDGERKQIGRSWTAYTNRSGIIVDDYYVKEDGYYSYKVRAISSDISTYQHSEWSDFSPAKFFTVARGENPAEDFNENITSANSLEYIYDEADPGQNMKDRKSVV